VSWKRSVTAAAWMVLRVGVLLIAMLVQAKGIPLNVLVVPSIGSVVTWQVGFLP